MATCFLCKRDIAKGERTWNLDQLAAEGIIIPENMTLRDVLCKDCYERGKAEYKQPPRNVQLSFGPGVMPTEIHLGQKLTKEKFLEMAQAAARKMKETGQPPFIPAKPVVVDHKDEDKGILEIDGKKVKKHDPEADK